VVSEAKKYYIADRYYSFSTSAKKKKQHRKTSSKTRSFLLKSFSERRQRKNIFAPCLKVYQNILIIIIL